MKKIILLLAIFGFSIVQPAMAVDPVMVNCVTSAPPLADITECKDFADPASADSLMKTQGILPNTKCTISTGTCSGLAPKPAAVSVAPETKDPDVVKLDNPLTIGKDVKVIIGTIIKGILGVMGALVLLMVVKGGSTWIMAAGSPEKVKEGSQTILWALLGAIITAASYIILSGIMKFF